VLVAKDTVLGWTARWNTRMVPNGTYQLAIVVDNRSGAITKSAPILVTVRN
jgi:hypothetical protein